MEVAGVEEGATTEERMEGTTRAEAAGLLPTFLLHLLLRQRRRESRRRERERERAKALSSTSFSLVEKKKKNEFFFSFIAPLFPLPLAFPLCLVPFLATDRLFHHSLGVFLLSSFLFFFFFFLFRKEKKGRKQQKK